MYKLEVGFFFLFGFRPPDSEFLTRNQTTMNNINHENTKKYNKKNKQNSQKKNRREEDKSDQNPKEES